MYAIILPPLVLLVFVGIMAIESHYTEFSRILFFGAAP
jgi:cytochrome c oxidase subunit IV